MPFATSSPLVMPPKMLMKIERTFGSLLMTSSAPAMHVGVGAAADVEEVRRGAADLVDDVDACSSRGRRRWR